MGEKNNILHDIQISQEELLGPPRIDLVGVLMMLVIALVVGFLSSIGVVIFAFLSLGSFSLGSGVSPILLAMITFFALTLSNTLYAWSARGIFPHVYKGGRTVFVHISVFSILLYISIAPLYFLVNGLNSSGGILIAYIAHIMLNIFGLDMIIGLLSGYKYSLLSLYSSIVSLILTATMLFFLYTINDSPSVNALLVLLGLSMFAFFMSIGMTFFIRFLYYRYYLSTGADPLGAVFSHIEQESKQVEQVAEQQLFSKN